MDRKRKRKEDNDVDIGHDLLPKCSFNNGHSITLSGNTISVAGHGSLNVNINAGSLSIDAANDSQQKKKTQQSNKSNDEDFSLVKEDKKDERPQTTNSSLCRTSSFLDSIYTKMLDESKDVGTKKSMFGEGVGGKEERSQTTNLSLCRTSSFLNTLYQTMIGKQGDTTLPISAVEDLTTMQHWV